MKAAKPKGPTWPQVDIELVVAKERHKGPLEGKPQVGNTSDNCVIKLPVGPQNANFEGRKRTQAEVALGTARPKVPSHNDKGSGMAKWASQMKLLNLEISKIKNSRTIGVPNCTGAREATKGNKGHYWFF